MQVQGPPFNPPSRPGFVCHACHPCLTSNLIQSCYLLTVCHLANSIQFSIDMTSCFSCLTPEKSLFVLACQFKFHLFLLTWTQDPPGTCLLLHSPPANNSVGKGLQRVYIGFLVAQIFPGVKLSKYKPPEGVENPPKYKKWGMHGLYFVKWVIFQVVTC